MGELEENLKQGHIKIHRSILENWIWGSEKKSMFEAWMYILLKANWKPGEIKIGYDVVKIQRGEFFTSQEQLGKTFRWDRTQVRKFLDMLKKESMVIVNATSKYTKITICKYDSYQDLLPTKNQRKTSGEPAPQHQPPTTKELEELKEVNKDIVGAEAQIHNQSQIDNFSQFSTWAKANSPKIFQFKKPLTIAEYLKLKEDFTSKYISDLFLKMENRVDILKKNESAYLTFRSWSRNQFDTPESPQKSNTPTQAELKTLEAKEKFKANLNGVSN